MSWTFNPPPDWPVPPGWQPPPGWTPDPGWPAAPAGWQFWVHTGPQAGSTAGPPAAPPAYQPPVAVPWPPGGPPPAPPPWYQRGWLIGVGAALLTVLLVGGVVGGTGLLATTSQRGSASGSVPLPVPTAPPRDGLGDTGGLRPGEERHGSGPAIVPVQLPADGRHTVTLTHTGGLFHARVVDRDGEFVRSLGGAASGTFTGTFPLDLGVFGEPSAIDIVDAGGSWTVRIEALADAPAWPDLTTGTGPGVLRVDPANTPQTIAVSHDGERNVFLYAHVPEQPAYLLVNEIGEYRGEVELPAETFVLEINTDGAWSIEPA